MKKIKNIIYIAILSLLVVSCEDNTDSVTNPGELNGDNLIEVKVGLTDDNLSAELVEGETTSFRLEMSSILDGEVTVSLNVTSSDGDAEATFPTTLTFQNGQRAMLFDVTALDDGISESEKFTLEITNVEVDLNTNQDYYVHLGDTTRTISIKDIPTPIVTTVGDLSFTLNWSGSNDLDFFLFDSTGSIVDVSWASSTVSGETVTLAGAAADGDYTVEMWAWTVNDASIDYSVDVVAPTETQIFSGNFSGLTGVYGSQLIVLEVNKSTAGGTVTYTINQL
ncbi:hypothetical protein MC378_12370 [Polaribacter sp. MSW13]|uniref:Calx-beta domain-containing protein n=1 Tax=Polaribacter marinus TaxID=2916838 RepID=A0A9X2ANJ1_9FLAO|nr:hypothetical protein [Polaribacter marinus]MCI2229964.1 hypothetical protein [Polaribacter marinus]